MNIFNVLTEIEKVDPEIYDRLDSRRKVFKHFAGFGKKLAVAAVPVAFGSMLNKAYGQSNSTTVIDTLKFAFLLENLEAEFYKFVVSAITGSTPPAGLPTGAALTAATGALTVIRDHEIAHVNFLRTTLTQLNATGVPTYDANSFDFTAKGALPANPDYPTILAAAQAFEDTGVRAYKGQAANLVSNSPVLQAALQIHSVEARHAAHIRRMRRDMPNGMATNKPWITLKDRGGLPNSAALPLQNIYDGEEITTQPVGTSNINIMGTFGSVTVTANAASEAFDEPLTKEQVTAIVTPFLKP